ncbi:response regulator transcription factor [Paenibacillus sacheonensis]|uniref:Response regulator n=1 Tax=Paenibacillus sacheonensis TaxID=742054 RepID=A0A7X4YPT7_9BACL|nr:response regulator [Paenibacillus sacheonensis]MBM7564959.1 YesN/AraC family two-component response regulator [Paenibacillus sacheonensis]NBC70253.1 response regulator [Paenibacillus sacheonensis]
MRIMIVDDEREIVTFLASMAGWKEIGCEVAWTASNGQEALEQLPASGPLPDVVITDIRMPVMDGITFAEELRVRYPAIPIVFLTAYHEFDYARKAIKLGVADFVTKPFLPEELIRTVASLRSQEPLLADWQEHNRFFELLAGEYGDDYKRHWLAENGLPDSGFLLLYAELDAPRDDEGEHFPFAAAHLRGQLAQAAGTAGLKGWTSSSASGIYVCLPLTGEQGERDRLMAFANEIAAGGDTTRGMSLSVGISQSFQTYCQLPEALRQVKKCMEYRMLLGKNSVIAFDAMESFLTEKEQETGASLGRIADALRGGDAEEIRALLKDSYRSMLSVGASKKDMQHYALQLIEKAEAALADFGLKPSHGMSVDIRGKLIRAVLLTDIMKELEKQLLAYQELMRAELADSPLKVISGVRQLIREQYMEELTLQSVAQKLNVNYSYLSRLIKKETGTNFTDLLWDFRIEAAKNKLLREDMKSYEVAYAVGFKDTAHFSFMFKKKVGQSPSAYRAQVRGGQGAQEES